MPLQTLSEKKIELGVELIYSELKQNLLLHQLYKPRNNENRVNLSPPNESIQVSHLKLKNKQTFKAHKHIEFKREMPMAQESWVVINGRVRVFYYDLDDSLITTRIINKGDCSITYRGGHNYESMEENSIVYEFKTGPYLGVEQDKVFI